MKKKIMVGVWKNKESGQIDEFEFPMSKGLVYTHIFLGTREIEVECEEEVKKPREFWIDVNFKAYSYEIEDGMHVREVIENRDIVTEGWFMNIYDDYAYIDQDRDFAVDNASPSCKHKGVPVTITYKRSDLK